MKISIIGYSGSGKSTLAKYLSKKYHLSLLHIDSIYFSSNWIERRKDYVENDLKSFLENTSWVIDGNYSSFSFEERMDSSDYIIYMNFNRFICLFRAIIKRYISNRGLVRDSVAVGCFEKMDLEFVKWILCDGRNSSNKKKYKKTINNYNDKLIIIKNQKELDNFVENTDLFIK